MTTFKELGLSEPIVEALTHLGYESPTPIQEQAIPALLEGSDVIGQAQTGTGKTAAFGLPLLQYIDTGDPEVQALVLTPTRELCIQVTQALRAYGQSRGIKVVAVFGGAPIRTQMAQLKEGGQVVVGTVGRVMDLMSRHSLVLDSARFVVLDEADEMLDLGFFEDVEQILSRCPSGRQTALFSATMPAPIKKLAEKGMYDPLVIKVKAATLTIDTVEQFFIEVEQRAKPDALAELLKSERPDQAIIFVRTKIGVDRLARALGDKGVRVKTLHGDMSQGSRDGVMIAFKSEREKMIVATDIAARGLDISGVTHVINYDIPNSPDVYVHRIGRTGRVGRSGRAVTLITSKQRDDLGAIERHAKTKIAPWTAGAKAPPAAVAPEPVAVAGSPPDPVTEAKQAVKETPQPPAAGPESVERLTAAPPPEPEPDEDRPSPRRPRHTKPRREIDGPTKKLMVAAGRSHGLEPADLIAAIVDNSRLDGEDVRNVRVLERFSLADVPADRAHEVAEKVSGAEARGVRLELEVADR